MLILVVDDEPIFRTSLRRTFEKKGYEVIEAARGDIAITLAKNRNPDLVIMDVKMPGLNGFDTASAIRALDSCKDIPIVFFTAKDTLEDRERGFALGASEFISKNNIASWKTVGLMADKILKARQLHSDSQVLIKVTDSSTNSVLINSLKQLGTKILHAYDSRMLLELATRNQNDIDLVIIESEVNEIPLEKKCSSLKSIFGSGNVSILLLLKQSERRNIIDLFNAGATDYLLKPFVKEELLARIEGYLERRILVKGLYENVHEMEKLYKLSDKFMTMISQDLKVPLNTLQGFSKLLLMENSLNKTQKDWVEEITQSTDFMLNVLDNVAEINRHDFEDDVEKEELDVRALCQLATSSFNAGAAKKGVSIIFEDNFMGSPAIDGNKNKFLRILNNLLSNAIKYTPKGKDVIISLEQAEGRVIISIADSGIGMPGDMLSTLWDASIKKSRPGTNEEPGAGLGLQIAHKLVNELGGSINVESTEGQGSWFWLTFTQV